MPDDTDDVVIEILAILGEGAIGAIAGLAISLLITLIVSIAARRRPSLRIFSKHVRVAQRLLFVIAGAGLAVLIRNSAALLGEDNVPGWYPIVQHVFVIVLILLGANLLISALRGGESVALDRYREDAASIHARRVRTQMQVIRRVGIAVVTLMAIAGILLTFPEFRAIGAALFTSAGVLSIVLGLAAQSSLGNLFAGVQIAFTDAVRVDDVVNVNGEFGTIEEITLTYVVVRTWDDRRLIVPSTYFTTTTFENWTRREPKLLGTVYFDLDVMTPVKAMRVELQRIVEVSDAWDGRTAGLQITDATGGRIEVRAVVSAATSGLLWDLRCEVREKMVEWIQNEVPYAMTRVRVEPDPASAPSEEDRSTFIEETEREWQHEKELAKEALTDTLDEMRSVDASVPAREPIAARRAREAAEKRDRKTARKHPGRLAHRRPAPARPSSDETQMIPIKELEVADDRITQDPPTAEFRLYSGNPEAEARGQRLVGPPSAEMIEREAARRRRAENSATARHEDEETADAGDHETLDEPATREPRDGS